MGARNRKKQKQRVTATSKIKRKEAQKINKRKATHKKAKKHNKKEEPIINNEETTQEKLERYRQLKFDNNNIEKVVEDDEIFDGDDGDDQYLTYFQNIDMNDSAPKEGKRSVKRKKIEEKNTPAEWEQARNVVEWNKNYKLPLKTMDGAFIEVQEENRDQEMNDENNDENNNYENNNNEDATLTEEQIREEKIKSIAIRDPELAKAQLYFERQNKIAKAKENLATIGQEILENPEEKIKRLKDIRLICEQTDIDTIKKLVLLSEVKIFKDIIPGYKIRSLKEEEEKVQVSKDVAKIREYEKHLLVSYQHYVNYLEKISKGEPLTRKRKRNQDKKDKNNLLKVALKCSGQLLCKVPHFNFRANLISSLVPHINSEISEISESVKSSFESLFKNDQKGDVSLEVVRKLCTYIRSKSYHVKQEVLKCFLSLPLTAELAEGDNIFTGNLNSKNKHISKKQKKKQKHEKKVEQELKEAEAEIDLSERRYLQTETLKTIFLLYFRIIKNVENSPLLPTVLEGLANFSHLINIDLLTDLLIQLKDLISRPQLTLLSKLHCAVTAFQTFKLQGSSLNIDLKDFYNHLYTLLNDIILEPDITSEIIPAVLRCFQLMLIDSGQLSLQRIAAYIKRLLTISLYLPHHASLAMVSVVHKLFLKYPKTQQLLDNERVGSGEYTPEVEDPENCNAFASTTWEFGLLNYHAHPVISSFSKIVSKMDKVEGNYSPFQLFEFYAPHTTENNKAFYYCNPPLVDPKPHPLDKKLEKLKKSGKESNLGWFVRPSVDFYSSIFAKDLINNENNIIISDSEITEELNNHFIEMNQLKNMDTNE